MPQLAAWLKSTSQPVEASPSQSPYPSLQVMPHAPFEQLATPFLVLQAVRSVHEVPQLEGLLSETSQPLEGSASQSRVLLVQLVHVPWEQ